MIQQPEHLPAELMNIKTEAENEMVEHASLSIIITG